MTKFERDRRVKIAMMWTSGDSFDAICAAVGMVPEDVAAIIWLRSIRDPAFIDRQGRNMAEVMRDERPAKEQRRRVSMPYLDAERVARLLPNITTPRLRARMESSLPAIRSADTFGGAA
jgi:hypothetical protein